MLESTVVVTENENGLRVSSTGEPAGGEFLLESATRASPSAGNAIVDVSNRQLAHARERDAAHEFTFAPTLARNPGCGQASSSRCDVVLRVQTWRSLPIRDSSRSMSVGVIRESRKLPVCRRVRHAGPGHGSARAHTRSPRARAPATRTRRCAPPTPTRGHVHHGTRRAGSASPGGRRDLTASVAPPVRAPNDPLPLAPSRRNRMERACLGAGGRTRPAAPRVRECHSGSGG